MSFLQLQRLTLVAILLLFCKLASANETNVLSQLDEKYQQMAIALQTNPSQIEKQLIAVKELPFKTPVERIQHHLLLSLAYLQLVMPDLALQFANQGLAELRVEDQPWLFHKLIVAKALSLELSGLANEGLALTEEALNWAIQTQDTELTIEALCARGLIYNTLMDSINALNDFQEAYTLATEDNLIYGKGYIAGLIAIVYEYRREPQQSSKYFKEALQFHEKHQQWQELGEVYYGLGRANKNLGHIELAHQQLEKSREIASKIDDEQGIAYALKELGGLEQGLGNLESSEVYYDQALSIFIKANNRYMLLDVTVSLARLAIANGDADKALSYILQAQNYLAGDSMESQQLALKRLQAQAYALNKQFEQAYIAQLEFSYQQNQLLKQQSQQKFHELAAKFELEREQATNQLLLKNNQLKTDKLSAEIDKNQFLFLLVILTLVICLLLAFILYRARQSKKVLEKLADIDSLTNIYNRRKTFELLDYQLELSKRHQFTLCLAVLDLDYFKNINDQYGHSVGDTVLLEFAALCQKSIRNTDILGRIGGEEFLIAFPLTSISDAKNILDKLREKTLLIAEKLNLSEITTSVSIGVTTADDKDSIVDLFSNADGFLYRAKNAGRNRIYTH